MTSSLDQLVAGSQGMIGKRIDLAFLDGQELLSRSMQRFVLVGTAMLMATAAWSAWAWALVLWAAPTAGAVLHLAGFGVLEVAGALGVVALARRNDGSAAPRMPNGGLAQGLDPAAVERRSWL